MPPTLQNAFTPSADGIVATSSTSSETPTAIKGKSLNFKIIAIEKGETTRIRGLQIGSLNTFSELHARLVQITGFRNVRVRHDGQRIDLAGKPDQTIEGFPDRSTLRVTNYKHVVSAKAKIKPQTKVDVQHFMRDSRPFRYLDLPREVRDLITEHAVVAKDDLEGLIISKTIGLAAPGRREPALSMTCRQLRREALDIYYSHSRFQICIHNFDFGPFLAWLNAIGVENSKLISILRIFIIHGGWGSPKHFFEAKESFLSSKVKVFFRADNLFMEDAWRHVIDLWSDLRRAGLSWEQIEIASGHVDDIMDSVGFEGEWPDDDYFFGDPYDDMDEPDLDMIRRYDESLEVNEEDDDNEEEGGEEDDDCDNNDDDDDAVSGME